MRKIKHLSLALMCGVCLNAPAHAQTVTQTTSMRLGQFVYNGTTTSISMNPASGTRTVTSGNAILLPGGTTARLAVFKVTGPANKAIIITLPSSVVFTFGGGPNITLVPVLNGPANRTLSPTGTITFQVGGNISIPAGVTGNRSYNGTFSVTAN